MNGSANDLTDRIAGFTSILCAVHVVHIKTWTKSQKYQATVLVYHSDFRNGHHSRPVFWKCHNTIL